MSKYDADVVLTIIRRLGGGATVPQIRAYVRRERFRIDDAQLTAVLKTLVDDERVTREVRRESEDIRATRNTPRFRAGSRRVLRAYYRLRGV